MKKEQLEQMLARASRSVQALNRDLARICPAPEEITAAAKTKEKRIRQSSQPLSNKLETRFGGYLHMLHPRAVIWEQSITFRLANGVRYTPDWVMCEDSRLSIFEIKGPRAWDDAIVKIKVAASRYPQLDWFLAWEENGIWKSQALYP